LSAFQRLSCGFQRLGLFSSGILLIGGGVLSLVNAIDAVNYAKKAHDDQVTLVCAQTLMVAAQSSQQDHRRKDWISAVTRASLPMTLGF
jgi:hypothetical protein